MLWSGIRAFLDLIPVYFVIFSSISVYPSLHLNQICPGSPYPSVSPVVLCPSFPASSIFPEPISECVNPPIILDNIKS